MLERDEEEMVGMKGAGRYPVTWSDTKACWRTKMRFRGKGSSSTDRFQPIKRHVQVGKEPVFMFLRHASRELGMIRKACWKMEGGVWRGRSLKLV
ncbi:MULTISPECIES: hypothetical protein [unclassified Bartonella]|uniref:hypothetical protein n=1 Tax=unclassified Bartonella TaxID=2645622 RepID=UPI0035CF5584